MVTDTVRQETHKEDIRLVEETKKWVLSPERKAPKKEREYAAARLDGVINKIKNVMQTALAKIQRTLMQPEVKQAGNCLLYTSHRSNFDQYLRRYAQIQCHLEKEYILRQRDRQHFSFRLY